MPVVRHRLEKIGLEAAMVLSVLNIWTGAPLLAIWVGGLFAESTRVSMTVVFLVMVVLFVTCLALIWALNAASARHDVITGRRQGVKRHVPWLRSMRAERVDYERERATVTTLDRIVVAMVVVAVIVFEAWFFLAAPSPIEPGPYAD